MTYYESARYTIYFYMAYYIPLAGTLRILLPTEIEIVTGSDPYLNLDTNMGISAPLTTNSTFGQISVFD
jgi:hypothetical protein